MSDKDLAVSAVSKLINNVQKQTVPLHLLVFEDPTVKVKYRNFIATRLDEGASFVKVVGFYCDLTEDEINKKYLDLVKDVGRELYIEVLVPVVRVIKIKNLIYKSK